MNNLNFNAIQTIFLDYIFIILLTVQQRYSLIYRTFWYLRKVSGKRSEAHTHFISNSYSLSKSAPISYVLTGLNTANIFTQFPPVPTVFLVPFVLFRLGNESIWTFDIYAAVNSVSPSTPPFGKAPPKTITWVK